jgi:hypothetical protein
MTISSAFLGTTGTKSSVGVDRGVFTDAGVSVIACVQDARNIKTMSERLRKIFRMDNVY